MSYALFVDSSTSVTLEPEYDFSRDDEKIEDVHRMRDGSMFRYKWGEFDKWKFSVRYVNSSDASVINNWFKSNQQLLFMEVGATQVHSVYITNKKLPISKLIKPYDNLFEGGLELETY